MDDGTICPIESIEAVQNELMDNMYIANVMNRIRELQSPSEADRTRWLWELLQNAQDSIKPDEKVNAKITVYKNNDVTFEHTGGIFTGKAMCGLLYKYSEGKGNEESTGRFGTGFMTTLTLSEIIEVETNIFQDINSQKVTGFRVTLYRNGTEKEELKEGLRNMRRSFKKVDPYIDFTTRFKYQNSNEEAIKLGLKSFMNCGAQTMLFATKVQNFVFNYKDEIYSIERGNAEKINDSLSIQSFTVIGESKKYDRKFILISIREPSELISKKYKNDRHLRLQIAIEFADNKLVAHEGKTCLYCTFPFIGSEKHQLPFIMNCSDFEPDTERQSLLLEGDNYIIKNNTEIINSPKINKFILKRSLELFKQLLGFIIDHQYKNLHFLTNGLILFDNIANMNKDWYFKKVITPMRNILEESPIVKTVDNEMTLLKNAYFPIYKKDSDEIQRKMYHNLVCTKYKSKTVTFEESVNWENRTWEELNLIKIEELIIEEEKLGSEKGTKEEKMTEEEWEYLNLLLEYTKQYEPTLLNVHAIIPDMKEKRHKYSTSFFESKEIHEDMLNILDSINNQWKSQHMHNKITRIEIPKHTMNNAIDSCIESVNDNNELSYIVSSFLPKDNSRRRHIFNFINEILEHHIEAYELKYEIDERLWITSDKYLISEFINKIERYQRDDVQQRFELCHRFVSFLNEQELENKFLNEHKIVPNENYDLCELSKLRDNSNIPQEFKQIVKDCFDIDINKDELNSQISELKCRERSTVQCYQNDINAIFAKMTVNKEQAAILLTHVLPKDQELNSYKTQSKLMLLLKPFETNSQAISTVTIDYAEESLWKLSNEYVKKEIIKENICKSNKLDQLTLSFKFSNDDETIQYLNRCYEFLESGKIMPNQYGTLCDIDKLKDGRGVDEDFLDLLKFINPEEYDYRLTLSDKRIDYAKINRFDIVSFYKKAESELESALKDEKMRDHPEFKEILKRMNKFDEDDCMSFFSNDQRHVAHRNMIYRIYVANVKNFLRKLDDDNADKMDKRRWGFELIQNARDTVSNTPGRKVSIEIIHEPHKYLIFRHDGEDFTFDSLIGLLFKTSEGKEYNANAVGRFGTGFMSTHILNRKIELKGNFSHNGKKSGFQVMINRTGKESKQLIKSAESMIQSFKRSETLEDYTEFKYSIENDRVDEIVKIGLDCIDENIPVTLLSCPEIMQIKVIRNNTEKIYSYKYDTNKIESIKIVKDGSEEGRCFLTASIDVPSKILSQFKDNESNLTITSTLEIQNQSIRHYASESLFCTFPLIGSKHELEFPITINCPSFEPSTERTTIILNKKEKEAATASSVNKEILKQSIQLFKIIVNQCTQLNIKELFILTNGLLLENQKVFNNSFDLEWYKNSFVFEMRKVLEESPIVKTVDNEMTLLKNAYFPIYKKDSDEIQRKMYHNLVCNKYKSKTVTFEESVNWENRTWEELNLIKIEELIIEEEKLGSEKGTKEEKMTEEEWEYLNLLLEYTKQYEPTLLNVHAIIPDMKEKRHKYSTSFFESKEIHEDMLNILDSINNQWKSQHMHNKITRIEIPKHTMNNAIDSCIESVNDNNELSYIVSSFLPKDNSRRRHIFNFINEILEHHIEAYELKYEIDERLWITSDKYLISEFINKIERYQRDDVQQRFELCHRFVSFLNEQELENKFLNEHKIVPNENYDLCELSKLRDNSNIPQEFKQIVKDCFDIDINKDELNSQISELKCRERSTVQCYQNDINAIFAKMTVNKEQAAILLTHVLPKDQELNSYKTQSKLMLLLKPFETNSQAISTVTIDYAEESLWKLSNEYVKKEIIKENICKSNKLDQLTLSFKFSNDDETIQYLNRCYEFLESGKIMPNQYGTLCDIDKLKDGRGVDEDFLDLLKFINPEEYDYRLTLSDKRIDYAKINRFDIVSFYKKAESELESALKDEKMRDHPEFKEILKRMNKFDEDDCMSFFSNDQRHVAHRNMIYRIYVANVKNFLRKLDDDNADKMDKRRWGFELIQNARDTVSNTPGRKVSIEIIHEPHKYLIFRHDGEDFTFDSLIGLLFKTSEGKEYNANAVGRFGTGFMSTHILNRKIELKGNFSHNGKKSGFQVMINRTGKESKQLIKSAESMIQSFKRSETLEDYTEFKYSIENDRVDEIVKIGLDCIDENIPVTLLSCPEIMQIKVIRNNTEKIYSYKYDTNKIESIKIVKDGSEEGRCFLTASIDVPSKILSQFKDNESNLTITSTLEIQNQSIRHYASESLFCTFPLIGSKHELEFPITINCPSFEPSTERTTIILNKKEKEAATASSVNKEILKQSIQLFKIIVNQCTQLNIKELFILTNGLLLENQKVFNNSFDLEWYKNSFVFEMRKVLEESPIVKTVDNEMTLLKNAYFPIYKKDSDEIQRKMYHNLVCNKYKSKTVTFEESVNWENRTWEELNLIKIEELIIEEEKLGSEKGTKEEKMTEEEWEYLNLLLEYTKQYEPTLLNVHAIIPDMKEKRHKYSTSFFESKEIHEDMLNILDSINNQWKSQHMHNKITRIEIPKHTMNNAIDSCIESVNDNNELSYIVSSFLPKDNSRRRHIFNFINEILEHHIEAYELKYEIDERLWITSDKYLISEFINKIERYQRDDVQQRFELCHRFVSFLNEQELENKFLNEHKIVPNENYDLCELSKLRDNSNIPDSFKNGVLTYFNIDINKDELNHKITDIHCSMRSEIALYQNEINDNINSIDKIVAASAFLLHFRPKKEEEDLYTKIEQIQFLYQSFLSEEEKKFISENNLIISFEDVIQTDLSSFALWNNASKNIIDEITKTINKYKQFQEFLDFNNFDEDKAISLLNQCYIYNEDISIPSLDGQMNDYKSHPIQKSDGIDMKFIELITTVDKDDKIKSELAWQGINHSKIVQYNHSQIIAKIQNATRLICQDENLKNDPNIKRLIAEVNKDVMNNILDFNDLNPVDKEKLLIFGKLFVSNLGPRLRELENPSDNIKKRWGWELIQNAKDTIAYETERKVNINFAYDKNHLIFTHDGNDFTLKQYLAMVYKFSEDKHEQKGSTGRFGTGFLTTHIISTEVVLRGNLKSEDGLKGFEVTLNRTGSKDTELEKNMKKTEESKKTFETTFDKTSFEYQYDDAEHFHRVEMGIENLKKNLPLVLLFCRNINTVVIENLDKNEKIEYSLQPESTQNINEIKITKNDKDTEIRRFIFFHIEKESNFVSNRYEFHDRNIEVNAVLEIDSENKIISHRGTESLYCVFPLIGSKHLLPIIINSPDFETSTERDNIFLKDSEEDKNTVDNINYEILGIGLELYQKIIEFCIKNKISCLYYLAEGLNNYIPKEEHFCPITFRKLFLSKAQEILISRPVFLTINGYKCITDATLIDYAFPTKEKADAPKIQKYRKDFYSLYKCVYNNPIEFEESLHWNSLLWSELQAVNHLKLLNKISECKSIDKLPFSNRDQKIQFINDTIDFVYEFDKVQFKEIKLIPNQNEQFCKDESNLYFANDVIEEAVNLIHRLGGEWRQNHVLREIKNNNFLPQHSIQDAEISIKNSITNENIAINSKIMMEYIIPNDQDRIKMHDYSHSILKTPKEAIELPGYSKDIWNSSDNYIIKLFISEIAKLNYVRKPIESVAWLNELILFTYNKGLKVSYLKNIPIFPNQNNDLKQFDSIFKDEIKYQDIKDALNKYCNIDVKDALLHSDFTNDSIFNFNSQHLSDYSTQIDEFFDNNYFFIDKSKFQFSIILLKYICDNKVIRPNQKDLIKALNTLFKNNSEEIELESSMTYSTFRHISSTISNCVNANLKGKTINLFENKMGLKLEEIIECLNIFYRFSTNSAYVPNQQKIFCLHKELMITKNENNIEKIIDFQVSISQHLKPEDALTYVLVMKGIKCPLIENSLDMQKACSKVDSLINEKHNFILSYNKNNNDLKNIMNDLIIYVEKNKCWEYFPNLKQLRDSLIANFIVDKDDRELALTANKIPDEYKEKCLTFIKELSKGNISQEELNSIYKRIFGVHLQGNQTSNTYIYNDYRSLYIYNNNNNRYFYHRYGNRSSSFMGSHSRSHIGNYYGSSSHCMHTDRTSYRTLYDDDYRPYSSNYRPSFLDYGSSLLSFMFSMANSEESMTYNRITGYTGEAYAYEKLRRAGFEVTWANLSDKRERMSISYNGRVYYIKESFEHYDLMAKKDGHTYYYEVKSTIHSFGNEFRISPSQTFFMSTHIPNATKRLMFVFDIRSSNPSDVQLELVPDHLMLKYIEE